MNAPQQTPAADFADYSRRLQGALQEAMALAQQHRVPVVVEVILEKVTNIAMGTEIDAVNEFEEIDCRHPQGREGLVAAGLLD